jgi:hypothetical protein
MLGGAFMYVPKSEVTIHLVTEHVTVTAIRSGASLVVTLGMATSIEDIREALQDEVSAIDLECVLRIWSDGGTRRSYEFVDESAGGSEFVAIGMMPNP